MKKTPGMKKKFKKTLDVNANHNSFLRIFMVAG